VGNGRWQPRFECLEDRTLLSGAANHLAVLSLPSTVTGLEAPVEVVALDAANDRVLDYRGTVHITSSDSSALLPGDFTFTANDRGAHLFNVTLETPGSQTVTFTDTSNSAVTGLATIQVNAAAMATHFALLAPATVHAGMPFPFAVIALDAGNHPVFNYTGTVHFTSSDSGASLPADFTFMTSDHGIHIFHPTLQATGSQTVTVTDTANSSITTQITLNVAAPSIETPTHFGVIAPSHIVQGVPFPIVVVALDADNHLVTNYTGTVHFTSTDSSASVPADFTFSASDNGFHAFMATLQGTGSQTINVTDNSTPPVTGFATVMVEAPAVATHFEVLTPRKVEEGESFRFAVIALDANNRLATSYTGTVHFTSSDSSAMLPMDFTFSASDNGFHIFTATLQATGIQTITATDTMTSSITDTETLRVRTEMLATGPDEGGGPEVKVFDELRHILKFDFMAFDSRFSGGVRVAVGDINGDGVPDIVVAPGEGGGPDIRVFDGATGKLIAEFMAFNPLFSGGVFVAVADINHDGFADIIVGAGEGGGPHVKVISGKDLMNGQVVLLGQFMAFDIRFHGGVRVSAGDINGDGIEDIVAAAGPGGGPHVEVFDGNNLNNLLRSFFAFDARFTGGVTVSTGDTDDDGRENIIVGAGEGGGPHLKVFDGQTLEVLESFFAEAASFGGGIRVAGLDLNGTGETAIVEVAGHDGEPHVHIFGHVQGSGDDGDEQEVDDFFAFDQRFNGGVFVGGDS
jgi:hypothetical protein